MSDRRPKIASILLKIRGKTHQISLYDFALFSGQSEDAGMYRLKIDGRWHSPGGKYTAFSAMTVAELLGRLLSDGAPEYAPRPKGLDKPVRVYAHWNVDSDDWGCGIVWTRTPPHLGADGLWWIWVDGPRLVRCDDIRVLTTLEIHKWTHLSESTQEDSC